MLKAYEKLMKKIKKDYDFVTRKLDSIDRCRSLRAASLEVSEDDKLRAVRLVRNSVP